MGWDSGARLAQTRGFALLAVSFHPFVSLGNKNTYNDLNLENDQGLRLKCAVRELLY